MFKQNVLLFVIFINHWLGWGRESRLQKSELEHHCFRIWIVFFSAFPVPEFIMREMYISNNNNLGTYVHKWCIIPTNLIAIYFHAFKRFAVKD